MSLGAVGGTRITILGRDYFMYPNESGVGCYVQPVPVFPTLRTNLWDNPEHDVVGDLVLAMTK